MSTSGGLVNTWPSYLGRSAACAAGNGYSKCLAQRVQASTGTLGRPGPPDSAPPAPAARSWRPICAPRPAPPPPLPHTAHDPMELPGLSPECPPPPAAAGAAPLPSTPTHGPPPSSPAGLFVLERGRHQPVADILPAKVHAHPRPAHHQQRAQRGCGAKRQRLQQKGGGRRL